MLPEEIGKYTVIILDTETTGLDKMEDTPFMLLIEINNQKYAEVWDIHTISWLDRNLPKAGVVVMHNAKYDFHMMWNGGVNPEMLYRTNIHDTFIAEALIDEYRFSYSLDALGELHFGVGKRTEELYGALAGIFGGKPDKKQMANIQYAPWELVSDYGFQDLELTRLLYLKQLRDIKNQELERVFNLEMDALKSLVEIERRGCPVDTIKVKRVAKELDQRQDNAQKQIREMVGWDVNPRSPGQMSDAFGKLGIPIKFNSNGNPTFAKDVLGQIHHPFINLLQESRNIKTMVDTFIGGSIGQHLRNGRIHTNFNQVRGDGYGTGTGRLSSNNPNLQQVPKRDGELAPLIRGLFYGGTGRQWISNDWEQFEFRMFAHYVKDQALINRYLENPATDFHQALSDVTGKPRDKAKRINLGLVFGMGEGLLASELGLPYTVENRYGKDVKIAGPEAKQLFAEYHEKFPHAKRFLEEASQIAKSRGYVKTLYGRRLRFPGGEYTHKAGGLVFQGSSADVMKAKLVEINNEYRNTDVEFNLIVHDEFDLIAPSGMASKVAARVKEITEDVPELRIPVLSQAGIGDNWWEACQ